MRAGADLTRTRFTARLFFDHGTAGCCELQLLIDKAKGSQHSNRSARAWQLAFANLAQEGEVVLREP
jgi:hypothetical protein